MPIGCIPTKHLPRFLPAPARRVHHVAQLEPVELARCTDRIRTHLVPPEPVPDLQPGRQHHRLAHLIQRVARRPPHAARRHGLRSRYMERAIHRKNMWRHHLMIKHNAVKGSVHPVVDVVCFYTMSIIRIPKESSILTHHARVFRFCSATSLLFRRSLVHRRPPGNDVGRQAERPRHIVSPGLRNHLDPGPVRKVALNRVPQHRRRRLQASVFESASDIQKRELISDPRPHVKCVTRTSHCVLVDCRIVASASDVEADTDHVQVQFPRFRQ